MLSPSFRELCDIEVVVTNLILSKSLVKETKKDFCVRKGMKPYARFFLVLNGKTEFSFCDVNGKNKKVSATKGDIVYLPNDVEYTSTWNDIDEINHMSVAFTMTDVSGEILLLNEEIFIITHDEDGAIRNAFEKLYTIWSGGEIGFKMKCCSLFYDILITILKDGLRREYNKKHNEIYKGILYLENNYLNDISVSELAKMCGVCETGFRSRFKAEFGMSPIEYKNYLRIKKAAELLRGGEYSVYEAADAVNIKELSYFNKLFKRYYNLTPGKYAKNM